MLPGAVQVLALALALLGVVGAVAATLLPNWKVSVGAWSSVLTPVSQMQGLWMDCLWYSSGVFSCTPKSSPLALPAYLQTARAAMVLCCLLGSFGLCLAALGLKCTRWGGGRRAKGHTAVAAGGCLVLASLLCLVPASWVTNEVVAAFLTSDLPDGSKYQPGGALCLTFVSAGFLLAAGVIFCLSCPGNGSRRPDRRPAANATAANSSRGPAAPRARPGRSVRLQTDAAKSEGAEPVLGGSYSRQEYV